MGTVKTASLMPECSHLGTPALIVASVNGSTWFWTLPLATMRIILIRSDERMTSLRSSWTAPRARDPLRWFADLAMEEPWRSSDAFYQHFQGLIRIWCTDGTQ